MKEKESVLLSEKKRQLCFSIKIFNNVYHIYPWMLLTIVSSLFWTVYIIVAMTKAEVYQSNGFNGFTSYLFHSHGDDRFMDFFNCIRDASLKDKAYSQRLSSYPPLAMLIFYILSCFTRGAYNATPKQRRKTAWNNGTEMTVLLLVMILLVVLLVLTVNSLINGGRVKKFLSTLFIVFSVPALFAFERGNLFIVSALLITIYAFGYNSKNERIRTVALICLAAAAALKFYPAVFGLFLLVKKRWRDIRTVLIWFLALFVLPSFFFGGPACIIQLFKNLATFSSATNEVQNFHTALSLPDAVNSVGALFDSDYALGSTSRYLLIAFPAALTFISFFLAKKEFQRWLALFLFITCVPGTGALYVWMLAIIPMIMLINMKEPGVKDCVYMTLLVLGFVPWPFIVKLCNGVYVHGANAYFGALFTSIITVVLIIDVFVTKYIDTVKKHRLLGQKVNNLQQN